MSNKPTPLRWRSDKPDRALERELNEPRRNERKLRRQSKRLDPQPLNPNRPR